MGRVSERIDRLEVVFDDESLVADGGLLAAGTLFDRLGLEELWDEMLRLGGRVGGANPGRRVLSLVSSMLVGGTHIDHADRLRAGATAGGVAASGDGPFHVGNVSAFVRPRRHRPPGRSVGGDAAAGVGGGCRPRWGVR